MMQPRLIYLNIISLAACEDVPPPVYFISVQCKCQSCCVFR